MVKGGSPRYHMRVKSRDWFSGVKSSWFQWMSRGEEWIDGKLSQLAGKLGRSLWQWSKGLSE